MEKINKGFVRHVWPWAAAVAITLVAVWVVPVLDGAQRWFHDLRVAGFAPHLASAARVTIVAITEDTLSRLPYRSPIDRKFLAHLLQVVGEAKPAAIGVDIFVDQPTVPERDAALDAAIAQVGAPVVFAWGNQSDRLTARQVAYLKAFFARSKAIPGAARLTVGPGGTARRFPNREGAASHLPFALAVAEAAKMARPAPGRWLTYAAASAGADHAFLVVPAHVLVDLAYKQPALLRSWIKGRYVLIGADLPHQDRSRTPFAVFGNPHRSFLSGVLIHGHALAQALAGRQISDSGPVLEVALIAIAAALGVALVATPLPSWARAVLLVVGAVAWVGVAIVVYARALVLLPGVSPTAAFAFAAIIAGGAQWRRAEAQRRFIRTAFSNYVAPSVVRALESDPSRLKLGGERRELTILFSDVAGFTTLSETLSPDRVGLLLNAYFDGLSKRVIDRGGTIDGFYGDGMMAFFGAPQRFDDHALRAVQCAIEISQFARAFSNARLAEGVGFGHTRLGIHTGPVAVGNFGGTGRFEYTVVGDTVNVAARLEQANRRLGTRICVSAATAERCSDIRFRPIGQLLVRGRDDPVMTFEPAPDNWSTETHEAFSSAYAMLESDIDGALGVFEAVQDRNPNDRLTQFHIERLRAGQKGVRIELI